MEILWGGFKFQNGYTLSCQLSNKSVLTGKMTDDRRPMKVLFAISVLRQVLYRNYHITGILPSIQIILYHFW
jgi:hypothetical protein